MKPYYAALITSGVPFLIAVFVLWMALPNHRKTKLWERKLDAYDRIIDALHKMAIYLHLDMENFDPGNISREERIRISADAIGWRDEKAVAKLRKIKRYDVESFYRKGYPEFAGALEKTYAASGTGIDPPQAKLRNR